MGSFVPGRQEDGLVTVDTSGTFDVTLSAPPVSRGTIQGIVTNNLTGAAIAGAVVEAGGTISVSGADGHFAISNALPGSVLLKARAAGYLPYTSSPLSLAPAGLLQCPVGLTPANRPPVANAGLNQTNECAGGQTPVLLVATNSYDPDGDTLTYLWSEGATPLGTNAIQSALFAYGTHTVTLTVTDPSGASSSATTIVAIVDTTPPNIVCPASMTVEFQDETGAVASFVVAASDGCSSVSLAVTPASGSLFPIGVTPVQATAVDAYTNVSQCTFTVTVLGAQGVKSNVLAQLVALRASATNWVDCWELDEAIEDMIDALGLDSPGAPPWVQQAHRSAHCGHHHYPPKGPVWLDETHVDRRGGWRVFASEQDAVRELVEIIRYRRSGIPDAVAQDLINRLVKCDRLLAVVSIQDAANAGANTNKIARILGQVTEGDTDAAANQPTRAIEDYWEAWTQVGRLHLARIAGTAGGQVQMQFPGTAGKVYRVQASSNLVDWQTVGTCTADYEGDVNFTDPEAAKHPARFYRVVEQ